MKYSFSIPQAQEVHDDKISLSDVLPGITVPPTCKSGQDIVFMVPYSSGEKICEGDTLVELLFYNSSIGHSYSDGIERHPILCELSGYIYHQFTHFRHTIDDLIKPIIIYPNLEELIDEQCSIKYHIKQDEFTSEKTIVWTVGELNNSDEDESYLDEEESYYSKYRLNPGTYIDLNVEKNLPVLILGFNRKKFKVNKRDTISFKFADGKILHFPVLASPTNNGQFKSINTVTVALSVKDIEEFENVSWERMRIDHVNGDAPITVNNESEYSQAEEFAQAFFKKYVQEYKHALCELGVVLSFVPKRPNYGDGKLSQSDEACYVYLMIDTSNGYYKIGISNRPDYREKTLQSEKPAIEKVCAKRFPSRIIAQSIEGALHTAFASKRIRGEWFNLSDKDVEQLIETLR